MPDLRPFFIHTKVRRQDPDGDVSLCDPDFDANCGYMSVREANILYQCAKQFRPKWVDIGGHTGWSAAHIAAAGNEVISVDPDFVTTMAQRASENLTAAGLLPRVLLAAITSEQCFSLRGEAKASGVSIDGHHTHPHPLEDAKNALEALAPIGCIFLHDTRHEAVRMAVDWLKEQGMKCREFPTMWGCAVCWRGDDELRIT